MAWSLVNVEARAKEAGPSFDMPTRRERENVLPGWFAKLIFVFDDGPPGERLWVRVTRAGIGVDGGRNGYRGTVVNKPMHESLQMGGQVSFFPEHIADIDSDY